MPGTRPTSVDEYLSNVPDPARSALEGLRRTIRALVPEAIEGIGYGMPAFKYRGRPLIYFGAAKSHCALYGVDVEAHRDRLAGYDASKGTLRFPPDRPPSEALLRELLGARIAAIEAAEVGRRKKPQAGT